MRIYLPFQFPNSWLIQQTSPKRKLGLGVQLSGKGLPSLCELLDLVCMTEKGERAPPVIALLALKVEEKVIEQSVW